MSLLSFFVFHHLTSRAFWLDEADVAIALEKNFVSLFPYAIYDGHPLPYIYLIKLWSMVSGTSEGGLRSFSAFFAVATIPAIYFLGKKMFTKTIGLWAAGITATNYFLIWFGTQNKAYAFITFLSTISTYVFLCYFRKKTRTTSLIYIVFSSFIMYMHPWYVFVLFTQAMLLLFQAYKHKNISILFTLLGISVLSLPAILIVLYQGKIGISSRITSVPLSVFWDAIGYLSFGSFWIYLFITCIGLFFAFHTRMTNPSQRSYNAKNLWLLTILTFVPLSMGILVSQFKPAFEVGRYEIIVLPPFILLLASVWSIIKNKIVIGILFLGLLASAWVQVQADQTLVQQLKSTDKTVSRSLLSSIEKGDIIITTDLSFATFYYYLKKENIEYKKNYQLLSFPLELSQHPGWKDLSQMMLKKEAYRKEAHTLVSSLPQNTTVLILYNEQNPLNKLLLDEMKKNYRNQSIKTIPEPHLPAWYDKILIYSN